jgi:hypothetical protein
MKAAFYLLTLVGLIGSYDVLYWHWYRLRLFSLPAARWENLTHALRALLFAVMMLVVLHVDARGWWWPLYPLVLAFEVTNTMADVILEPRSRRDIGGLPAPEYIIHIFLSIMTGAALASVIWGTRHLFFEPSLLGLGTIDVPLLPRIGAYASVVVAIGMFFFELGGVLRLAPRARAVVPARAVVQD